MRSQSTRPRTTSAFSAATEDASSLGRKPESTAARLQEAPEVEQAMAKASDYATLAGLTQAADKRDYYLRMERKWLGIAEGWRVIAGVDNAH